MTPRQLVAARRLQRAWRAANSRALCRSRRALRELAVCCVCHDECVRLVRCRNGHARCVGCALSGDDLRCPVCREVRPPAVDASLPTALRECRVSLTCGTCRKRVSVAECEHHRAWCPAYRFICPWVNCMQCLTTADLAAHVLTHEYVPRLRRPLAVTVALEASDSLTCVVGARATVVTISSRPIFEGGAGLVQIKLRGYYASDADPPLVATVQQLHCVTLDVVEEHRIGIVSPVLASREASDVGTGCVLEHKSAAIAPGPPICVPDVPALLTRSQRARLLPIPALPLHHVVVPTPAALLHVSFVESTRQRIGANHCCDVV